MRLKLISDGTSKGTEVIDITTGRTLPNVLSAEYIADFEGGRLVLIVRGEADIEADVHSIQHEVSTRLSQCDDEVLGRKSSK